VLLRQSRWGTRQAVWSHAKPRSREGKRTGAVCGRRAADGSPRVRGVAAVLTRRHEVSLYCPCCRFVFFSSCFPALVLCCCVRAVGELGRLYCLTRSREAAKGNAEVRCVAGEPRTGVRGCGAWLLFWRAAAAGRARATATQRSRGAETVCCSKSHEVRSDVERVAGGIAGAVGQCDCGITAGAELRAGCWADLFPAAV
jgi:hypothetical protein